MSTTQLAIVLGAGVGAGLILVFYEVIGKSTRQPHLGDAATRLTGSAASVTATDANGGHVVRVGLMVLRRAAGTPALHIPHHELALVGKSSAAFLGERVLFAAGGLVLPPVLALAASAAGLSLPVTVPVGGSVVVGLVMSYIPWWDARTASRRKRAEFRRALASYVDLVALERAAGAGATQALESAAGVGDSWAFQRIRDELARARWSGVPAWDALRTVGDELQLPELSEFADVMRMSAREGATVYHVLRARASSLRAAILTGDQARAGSRTERAAAPLAATSVVFMLILAAPVAMTIG